MILTEKAIESIDAANIKAWKMVRTDPAKTLTIAKDSLERSKELGYDKGVAWATGNIGAANTWLSDYEKSLTFCFEAVDLLYACGEYKQEVQIHYYLSIIFYFMGDREKQLEHVLNSLKRAEEIGDVPGQANAFNGIGTVHYSNGDNLEAIKNLESGVLLAKKGTDEALLARLYDGLGNSFTNLKKYDEALKYMFKALEVLEKSQIKQTLSYAHDGIGVIYTKLENYPKALEHYDISYKLREEMGFKDGMGITKIHIGETFSLAGDNLSAVQSYKDVLVIAKELNSNELSYKAHKGLSELYEDMGNLTLFVKHFKAYHADQQNFFSESEGKKIKAFELKGRLDQIQKEKDELEKKNNLLQSYFTDVQTLGSIGREITSTLDIESIFTIIYERISSLMNATGLFVGVCDYKQDKLKVELAINRGVRDTYFEHSLKDRKLANWVIDSGEDIHINDYSKEIFNYYKEGEAIIHDAPESVAIIPLIVKEKIIGVLYTQSDKKNAFSDHQINILKSFASSLSIALDNAWLYEQMDSKVQERTDELRTTYENSELLNKIGQELISTLNFGDVFETLYENVNKLMDATVFGVRLLDKDARMIRYPFEYEKGQRLPVMEADFDNENNYSSVCMKRNEPILINDNKKEYGKWVNEIFVIEGELPESLIFYPLIVRDEVIGCISVQAFQKNAYDSYELSIVKTLAQYTSLALKNALDYESMEDKVAERTTEITKTYEDSKKLSEIGKLITSQLSVEKIIEETYKSINEIMDAEGFGIGTYNEKEYTLSFHGYIESGERLKGASYSLEDQNRLACVCFAKDQDIVINDLENEFSKYVDKYTPPKVGRTVTSLIYLTLKAKDKKIGVITVQSFEKNIYSEYQMSMLKSIAVYTGIAMDNAALYENMEDIVKDRTSEVIEQKEQIEQNLSNTKLISQINKDISNSLTIESIVAAVYENVNALMDAAGFGIGIFKKERNVIVMTGYIEKGEQLDDFEYNIEDQRLAPYSFRNKKEIVISNYSTEYQKYISDMPKPVSGKDSASIVYIPLFSKEKIIGLLTVQSFDENAYNEYHLDILRGLAASIGGALENALLYESLEDKVRDRTVEVVKQKEQIEKASKNTKLLSEIGKDIASELNVEDVISRVYESVNSMMDASVFGIAIYNENDRILHFSGAIENGTKLDDFQYDIDDEKIATRCFNSSEEIVINDWKAEYKQYVKEDYNAAQGDMPESMIYLPLVSKENKIGVMTVQSFTTDVYNEYHLNILRTLSLYIANALENANLYKEMENRVKERTAEIATAYENTKLLSQISKTIVESLEVESIIKSVHEGIDSLLDATCFGIGIYDEAEDMIKMPGFIEDNVVINNLEYEASNLNKLASVCFAKNKEIFISDFFTQYKEHVSNIYAPLKGEGTNSIIYLPLNTSNKVVGVLTVQSYDKNAYTEYHLSILRSLSTTIATAIDNAMLYENMEEKVRERTFELSEQKEIIEEKNKHITDSIIYAKRIQDATLPSTGLVRSYLEDSFVLFKPKDIVSGDFYWITEVGDEVLFAVVDCTGHGVPGAFLSLIGHNSLNQIVNELEIYKPSDILFELDKIVYKTLQNNLETTNIKDGMDMSICSYNSKTKVIQYAGAYNPIYLVREGELIETKGDKIAIGSGQTEQNYTNHDIQLQKGDCIYLSSDGYADQFGGDKGKKFKYSNFKKLLIMHADQNMSRQHDILEMTIDEWQGDLEQLDDVCVIGMRI